MMRVEKLTPVFVDIGPEKFEAGYLYVSMSLEVAIHLCCCGCSNQVVTPLTPDDWSLRFDGRMSLSPSIGNWSFPCRSHYFITNNKVRWAQPMSDEQVGRNRLGPARDRDTEAEIVVQPRRGLAGLRSPWIRNHFRRKAR